MAVAAQVLIGKSLWQSWLMFWATLWPLALGFAFSGWVQAFTSRKGMEKSLGNHRVPAILRATVFGAASSSCSYAATSMSRSLFSKGADFITSLVFMVASTNLVVEIALVLIALLGWQFAAAEFVGGPIMIALLAWLGIRFFPAKLTRSLRERLNRNSEAGGHHHDHGNGAGDNPRSIPQKLKDPGCWANAASYTIMDLSMLRNELVIGFVIAGALTILVPEALWQHLFLQDHGVLTSIQNAFIGPLIAVISFVCSVGNVAMAASLWHAGISFGGVISFIFGDLITLPLLLIYSKMYGRAIALRMFLGLWLLMAISGLITEWIFSVANLIPADREISISAETFTWNSTTVINIIAILLLALAWWIARNKHRFGAATDSSCEMHHGGESEHHAGEHHAGEHPGHEHHHHP
ncbi:MAG: permease [Prochlorococcus sp.]